MAKVTLPRGKIFAGAFGNIRILVNELDKQPAWYPQAWFNLRVSELQP